MTNKQLTWNEMKNTEGHYVLITQDNSPIPIYSYRLGNMTKVGEIPSGTSVAAFFYANHYALMWLNPHGNRGAKWPDGQWHPLPKGADVVLLYPLKKDAINVFADGVFQKGTWHQLYPNFTRENKGE